MTNLLLLAFDLSAPMTGEQFLRMPEEYRRAYLDGLIGRFGATDKMMAAMFGVHQNTVFNWRARLGVDCSCGCGCRDAEARFAWRNWLKNTRARTDLLEALAREHPEVTLIHD